MSAERAAERRSGSKESGRTVRVLSAEFEAGATREEDLVPPSCEEVAFVGKSNVGKSSLMNALLGRRGIVRTSSTPGCTRQINLFAVSVAAPPGRAEGAGAPGGAGDAASGAEGAAAGKRVDHGHVRKAALRFVDLPGYGYAKLSKAERAGWQERLEGYMTGRPTLTRVVLVVDARRGVEDDDAQMAEFVHAPRRAGPPPRLVVVATKLDKLSISQRKPTVAAIARSVKETVLGFSATTGEGREALWAWILGG